MCQPHFEFIRDNIILDAGNSDDISEGYGLRTRQQVSYAESPVRTGFKRQCIAQFTPGGASAASSLSQEYHPDSAASSQQEGLVESCSQKIENGIRRISGALGVDDEIHFTSSCSSLAQTTKSKRANVALKIIHATIAAFAPDAPDELMGMVFARAAVVDWPTKFSRNFVTLVQDVADIYPTMEGRAARLIALGLVAPFMSYSDFEKFFPRLDTQRAPKACISSNPVLSLRPDSKHSVRRSLPP